MDSFESFGTPTVYDGDIYASLTEARWAALFRIVGMPSVYEPNTYEKIGATLTVDGQETEGRKWLYTPDFWLPEQSTFVEIKCGNANDGTAYKLGMLAMATGFPGLLINGKPGACGMYWFSPDYRVGTRNKTRHGFTCNLEYSWADLAGRAVPSPLEQHRWKESDPNLAAKIRQADMAVNECRFTPATLEQQEQARAERLQKNQNPITLRRRHR